MYETFWGLDRKPFENRFDAALYYASQEHRAAELKLRYVLESRLPAVLLSGGAGVGKSLLLHQVEEQTRGDVVFHRLQFPQLPSDQLMACVAARLAGEPVRAQQPLAESLRKIEQTLADHAEQQQHTCLIVDECHVMSEDSLEALRLMLNFAPGAGPGLTLLLCGQSSVRRTLQMMPQLEERLAAKLTLSRLTAEETSGYVRHRLAEAGAERPIFGEAALEEVHRRTRGVPGRINRLGDMTLLVGYADDVPLITPEQVRQVDQGLFTAAWAA